eukprot:TRINITY_DN3118_c0_g1_i17.p1 TRINITY_DN3118_c0_g1~~TRINITY_DN3118_c0_g1_i17.p1  ORF type:complete len:243 (-),score=57.96 TRINITY_DN3118_c0_g1_i17:104-832(-)
MHKVAKIIMQNSDLFDSINIIKSAKVPIVKIRDIEYDINFDISFNKMDGLYQIDAVQKALQVYPAMKYIILILKLVLRQRELSETYKGGIGSFLLFCMTLAFFREVKKDYISRGRIDDLAKLTLGEYLLRFLEFYGIKFDCNTQQVVMTNHGSIIPKEGPRDGAFSLISPQDERHDIGNAAFKIKDVFGMFKNRFHFLTNYNFKMGESILKYLVNPSLREFAIQTCAQQTFPRYADDDDEVK